MSYPSLEKYNEILQHPKTAFLDQELRNGSVEKTGLGLPLALCGGFALTYTITTSGKKYAVRCFHKQSNELERRYKGISNLLKSLQSPYFLKFEFQPQGIHIPSDSQAYPIVKMAWAAGITLGQFAEQNYHNRQRLEYLNTSLRKLAVHLESHKIAHGDIQPGNIMVSNDGHDTQLIDYDGMYIDDLKSVGSAELGHRNFQHPGRIKDSWDFTLDRFSFISLNLAFRILIEHPELWTKTQSDADSILFKANDFTNPDQSDIFKLLSKDSKFSDDLKNFAAICKAPFSRIPSLEDYLVGSNVPNVVSSSASTGSNLQQTYISPYPILNASDYEACLRYVGDKVELIGCIIEVKESISRYGRPYTFINFGPWKGKIVKISIWSKGLATLSQKVDQTWTGKWVCIRGLMEPPYISNKHSYSHLSISLTEIGQLREITEAEAKYRLFGNTLPKVNTNNRAVLGGMPKLDGEVSLTLAKSTPIVQTKASGSSSSVKSNAALTSRVVPKPQSLPIGQNNTVTTPITGKSNAVPKTNNQAILQGMKNKLSTTQPQEPSAPQSPAANQITTSVSTPITQVTSSATPSPTEIQSQNSNLRIWLLVASIIILSIIALGLIALIFIQF